jgi:hypothetical protein
MNGADRLRATDDSALTRSFARLGNRCQAAARRPPVVIKGSPDSIETEFRAVKWLERRAHRTQICHSARPIRLSDGS